MAIKKIVIDFRIVILTLKVPDNCFIEYIILYFIYYVTNFIKTTYGLVGDVLKDNFYHTMTSY